MSNTPTLKGGAPFTCGKCIYVRTKERNCGSFFSHTLLKNTVPVQRSCDVMPADDVCFGI